jgi:hypothetical protein
MNIAQVLARWDKQSLTCACNICTSQAVHGLGTKTCAIEMFFNCQLQNAFSKDPERNSRQFYRYGRRYGPVGRLYFNLVCTSATLV